MTAPASSGSNAIEATDDPEQLTASLLREDSKRQQLADGLELKQRNTSPPGISVVRSLILLLVAGGGLTGLVYMIATVTVAPDVHEFGGDSAVDLCKSGTATDVNGSLLTVLNDNQYQKFNFQVKGTDFPVVAFYSSQRERQINTVTHMVLSAYYMRQHEVDIFFSLQDSTCLSAGSQSDSVINQFGAVVAAGLDEAGRFQNHAAYLIREDINALWDKESLTFQPADSALPSWTWYGYIVNYILTMVMIMALHLFWFVIGAIRLWRDEAGDYRVRYDYLYHDPESQSHMVNLFSMYFVLDHLTGDEYVNAEQWGKAIVSTLIHAVVCVLYAVLPAVFGIFVQSVKLPFCILISLYGVSQLASGIMYYFTTGQIRQTWMVVLELSLSAVIVLLSLLYWCAILVFFVTVLVEDPDAVISLMLPGISVIGYCMITYEVFRLAQMDTKKLMEGKVPKREVFKVLSDLGLDTKSILIFVGMTAFALVLVMTLLLFTAEMTAGGGNVVSAVGVPLAAVGTSAAQSLQMQRATREQINKFGILSQPPQDTVPR